MTSRLANSTGWALVPVLIFLAGTTCGPLSRASAQSAAQPSSSDGGDEEIVAYRSFTQADGLPHSTVQVLAQAPDGQLWIGTSAGLAVYDGHRIQSAPLPDSLENRFICDILPHESGAVWLSVHDRALVALRNGHVERVVPLLYGGNIDPARLQEVLDHAMTDRVQLLRLRVRIEDQPGTMADISQRIAGQGANIREVRGETGRQPAPSVVSVPVPKCDGLSDRRRRCTRGVSVRSVSPATGCRSGSPRLRESAWFGCCYTEKRYSQANPWNKIARSMHHSLQDPQDQVVGFVLDADRLGHEIYRILDWADEHFRSHSVDQADGRVYVRSDAIEDEAALHTEPLSVDGHAPASDSSRNGEGDGGRAEPVGM